MKTVIQAALVTIFAASTAHAQQAVQWRIEDGGNGHWYQLEQETLDWPIAQQHSVERGAHLVTIRSQAEYQFLRSNLGLDSTYFWIGAFQQPGSCEPDCGWRWVTDEAWDYVNWNPGEPSNSGGNENWMECYPNGGWNDRYLGLMASVRDWSADCNGDGIIDYGQCRDGWLPDYNGNNVPDCCEDGTTCITNLIFNGSFGLGIVQPCGWICIGVGDNRLEGWEVTLNSVDRERTEPGGCNENWFASHGNYSVDMNGCSVGGIIRQHVATEVGRSYLLSFDMSLNPTNVAVGLLRVRAGGTSQDFEYLRTPTNPQPNEHREMAFVASSVLTTIDFESMNREYAAQWNGPVIDFVRLVPTSVPPPTCIDADIYRDFNVNGADLGILLSQWGASREVAECEFRCRTHVRSLT